MSAPNMRNPETATRTYVEIDNAKLRCKLTEIIQTELCEVVKIQTFIRNAKSYSLQKEKRTREYIHYC